MTTNKRQRGDDRQLAGPPWLSLWGIQCRVRGIGVLLRAFGHVESDLNQEEAFVGLSDIICRLADGLSDMLAAIEEESAKSRSTTGTPGSRRGRQ